MDATRGLAAILRDGRKGALLRMRLEIASARSPVRSIENDTDSSFLAPDQLAGQMRSFGDQREMEREFRTVSQIHPRACGGDVANHAGERVCAKFDRSGDGHIVPRHSSPLGTTSAIGCSGLDHMESAAAVRAAIGPYRVAFGTGHDAGERHARIAFTTGRFWEKRFGTHRKNTYRPRCENLIRRTT
jgi:hypothetical protein